MKLYLVRHGEACDIGDSLQRPLTEQGINDVKKVGQFLNKNKLEVEQVYHSDVLRAAQTAAELANALEPRPTVAALEGLHPNDSVKSMALRCNEWDKNTMLVGHLPFMANLVSEILVSRDEGSLVSFQTAAILCLERIALYRWHIAWFIHPGLLD